jgi:uncharacterized integral membrane protein (TIGR00698 family)
VKKLMPGLALCLGIAIVATFLGRFVPIVGGAVFAIVLGVAFAAARKPATTLVPGMRFASKTLLQTSIVLLGTGLDLGHVAREASSSLPLMLGTMTVVLVAAYVLGRALNLRETLRTMLGVGTAICGASAIAAISTVIGATEPEIAYAISTIFLFNVIAVLVFPALGHALHMSQHVFGVWAGTAINDTSSVVAAGYAYGQSAGDEAVIVKLTRATLILPIVAFFAVRRAQRERKANAAVPWASIIPWFILYFVAATLAETFGVIPPAAHGGLNALAVFLIAVALAGVGLATDVRKILAVGPAPLVVGCILWVLIGVTSLAIQGVL